MIFRVGRRTQYGHYDSLDVFTDLQRRALSAGAKMDFFWVDSKVEEARVQPCRRPRKKPDRWWRRANSNPHETSGAAIQCQPSQREVMYTG